MRPAPLLSLASEKCPTGCALLDTFLRGGIPCGSLTELAGEAAACKTQLCLQLLASAVRPAELGGLGGAAMYFYTEGDPPIKRLQELVRANPHSADGDPMASIFVESRMYSPEGLLERLQRCRTLLQPSQRPRVRLLVIDSVAHLFRDPGDEEGAYMERAAALFRLAALLKQLATRHGLAVVLTNQVVDSFADEDGGAEAAAPHTGGLALTSSDRRVLPALGLAWANCVSSRLFLARGPDGHCAPGKGGRPAPLRCLQVVFSPHLPQSYCYFTVSARGVRGLPAAQAEPPPLPQDAQRRQGETQAAAHQAAPQAGGRSAVAA